MAMTATQAQALQPGQTLSNCYRRFRVVSATTVDRQTVLRTVRVGDYGQPVRQEFTMAATARVWLTDRTDDALETVARGEVAR